MITPESPNFLSQYIPKVTFLAKHGVTTFFVGAHVMLGFNWFPVAFACLILGSASALIYGHLIPEAQWHLLYIITMGSNIVAALNYYDVL